jgi:hypothetical protein
MERLADEAREPEELKAPELKYWQKVAAEREAAAEVEGVVAGGGSRNEPIMSWHERHEQHHRDAEVEVVDHDF